MRGGAAETQERADPLQDTLADQMAEPLAVTFAGLSPWAAAERFYALAFQARE